MDHAQHPPPQHPPPATAVEAEEEVIPGEVVPMVPATASSRTVSVWPWLHVAGSPDRLIGRFSTKVEPHVRHLNS